MHGQEPMQLQSSLFVPVVVQLAQLGDPTIISRPGIGGVGKPTGGIGAIMHVVQEGSQSNMSLVNYVHRMSLNE